ncbi:MAG: CpsD/CapB family tyrosine-protein kinase [Chloroflexi bacterium]|nr:CpsD/CapB family tyrosine-protein kinase [Chloroflexota bacterium]
MKLGKPSPASGGPDGLIAVRAPNSLAAEAYRTLRTNIQFSSLDRDVRTLLVTSVGPKEGKSLVLANLGITMAESGRRVVMVDCDLRRPSLHDLFGLADGPGVTTMVLDAGHTPPLQPTLVANLSLIPSGPLPPNPAELLASERFSSVVQAIAKEADHVLFDAPPVASVSDAAVLATRVDGVLLVVDAGRTRRDAARRAKEQLERVGARVLGVVLNNVRPERVQADYYGGTK